MRVMSSAILILHCLASPTWALTWADEPRLYVTSVTDFETHTIAHRRRVEILGMDLYLRHAARFPGVDPAVLQEFLRLHDEAKMEMLGTLYRYYGKKLEELPETEKARALELKQQINLRDNRLVAEFFHKKGLLIRNAEPSPVANHMVKIAHIADLVDRAENVVSSEEFGRPMTKAFEILPEEDRKLAKFLSGRYKRLVKGWEYVEVKARYQGSAHSASDALRAPAFCVPIKFLDRLIHAH